MLSDNSLSLSDRTLAAISRNCCKDSVDREMRIAIYETAERLRISPPEVMGILSRAIDYGGVMPVPDTDTKADRYLRKINIRE